MPTKKLENNSPDSSQISVYNLTVAFSISNRALKTNHLPVSYDVLASKLFTKMHGFLLITSQKVAD